MRRLWRSLLDIVFPAGVQCICCRRAARGALVCEECAQALEELRCEARPDVVSVWAHRGCAAKMVHMLKYDGTEDAASLMAREMARAAGELAPDTVITWVPASPKRRRARGVDHGYMLAEAFARETGLPAAPLLARTGERRTQWGLDRQQRLENVKGAFVAKGDVPRRVLLVDDVFTTGATARECALALTAGGAQSVRVVTATRAEQDMAEEATR